MSEIQGRLKGSTPGCDVAAEPARDLYWIVLKTSQVYVAGGNVNVMIWEMSWGLYHMVITCHLWEGWGGGGRGLYPSSDGLQTAGVHWVHS